MSVDVGPGTRLLCVVDDCPANLPGLQAVKGLTYTCQEVSTNVYPGQCHVHGEDCQAAGVQLTEFFPLYVQVRQGILFDVQVTLCHCLASFVPLQGDLPEEILAALTPTDDYVDYFKKQDARRHLEEIKEPA